MFAIVAVPFEAFQALPPFDFKLMAAVLRYVNRQGECCPALHQLAADVRSSEATVSRAMARLERQGCFARERQGNGRYLYRVAERFLGGRAMFRQLAEHRIGERATSTPEAIKKQSYLLIEATAPIGAVSQGSNSSIELSAACREGASIEAPSSVSPDLRPIGRRSPDSHLAPVQDGLSHGARQEVTPSSDLRSSEGEQAALSADEIPIGWEEAAAAERRLAGLPEVNLRAEWRKLLAYSEGARITIWRWRGWALKARCEVWKDRNLRSFQTDEAASPKDLNLRSLGGDERQQRQARDWVRRGFWLRSGAWGPAPDQEGCELPPALIEWCLRERQARAA